ncbi:MAG: Hpt domain-containing protein [Magnetovibrionaceae bacterium]
MSVDFVDPDLEMVLADLTADFVVNTRDKLDVIDDAVHALADGNGPADDHILEIKRLIHSIKGGGGAYGFPTLSKVAHAMEDYLETADELPSRSADLMIYLQTMLSIVETGQNPDETLSHMMLRSLPRAQHGHSRRVLEKGTTLLVMPRGVQRKIVSRELTQFGFKAHMAYEPLAAIDLAVTLKPDFVIADKQLIRFTGLELARVFSVLDATSSIAVGVITSVEPSKTDPADLPPNARWLHKGSGFSAELMGMIKDVFAYRKSA